MSSGARDLDLVLWATLQEWLIHSWPVLLVCLFGLVLAMVRWPRHPRISLTTTVGLAGVALEAPFFMIIAIAFPSSDVIAQVESMLYGGFLALLLIAIFVDRDPQPVGRDQVPVD